MNITVLYGTETGNAEGCAEELLEGVQGRPSHGASRPDP